MAVTILAPKYRRDPNEKISSLYYGVASGGRTVTSLVKPSLDRNHLEATKTYGPGIPRGQGGRIAHLIIGGLEATLDEVEYLLDAKKEKKFVFRRAPGDIAEMCRTLLERRNERIRYLRKHPSENLPLKRRPVRMYLPMGYRMVKTAEPGLRIAVKG